MEPLVSVIIVNWNWKKWLQKCLDSLTSQSYKNIEIIVVDNHSTDGSVEYIKKRFSKVLCLVSSINGGFAFGNNLWIKHAKWELILLLNNDTRMENNFIEELYKKYIITQADVIAPQEAKYSGAKIESEQWTIDPFWHWVKVKYSRKKYPFYLQWLCLMFSKNLYVETGWLDEDFFMYFEETDWFWRLNLYGMNIVQIDDLWIYHAGAGSTGSGMKYKSFLWRNENTLQMLLKNYAWYNLLWTLPLYFLQNIVEIIFFLIILKPKIAWSYVEWWIFNIRYLKRTLLKRGYIQTHRKVGEKEIIKKMYIWFAKLRHLIHFLSSHD